MPQCVSAWAARIVAVAAATALLACAWAAVARAAPSTGADNPFARRRVDSRGDDGAAAPALAEAVLADDGIASAPTVIQTIPPSRILAGLPNDNLADAASQRRIEPPPATFASAVRAFYAALEAKDLHIAHALCEEGYLWQPSAKEAAPIEFTTERRKSRGSLRSVSTSATGSEPLIAIDIIMAAVPFDVNVLDIAQCLVESGQVSVSNSSSRRRRDWFGLTQPGRAAQVLLTAMTQHHPGLVKALLDLGTRIDAGGRQWKATTGFHSLLVNERAHRFVRSGLNPKQNIAVSIPWIRYDQLTNLLLPFGPDVALEYQRAIERLAEAARHNTRRSALDNGAAAVPARDVLWEDATRMFAGRQAYLIKTLKEYGLRYDQVELRDDFGRTVFHIAAMHGIELALHPLALDVQTAAANGVLDMKDRWGYTALDYARFKGYDRVGRILASAMGGDNTYFRYNDVKPIYVEPGLPELRLASHESESGGWNTEIAYDLLPEGGLARCDVDQRSDITAEEFIREYDLKDRPLILRGYARDWDVRELWKRDALKERRGDLSYEISEFPYAKMFGMKDAMLSERMPMAEYIDLATGKNRSAYWAPEEVQEWIDSGRDVGDMPTAIGNYIFSAGSHLPESQRAGLYSDLGHIPPPFLNVNFTFPRHSGNASVPNVAITPGGWVAGSTRPFLQFFLGAAGTGAQPHFHGDAYNVIAYGAKRWLLAPPSNSFYSATSPLRWLRNQYDDWKASPRNQTMVECVQGPGDVIFVPDTWTHMVLNLQDTVGAAVEFQALTSTTQVRSVRAAVQSVRAYDSFIFERSKTDATAAQGHRDGTAAVPL